MVLKKKALFFSYDDTFNKEKEFYTTIIEKKMYFIEFKICVIVRNQSCIVVTHHIFLLMIHKNL